MKKTRIHVLALASVSTLFLTSALLPAPLLAQDEQEEPAAKEAVAEDSDGEKAEDGEEAEEGRETLNQLVLWCGRRAAGYDGPGGVF